MSFALGSDGLPEGTRLQPRRKARKQRKLKWKLKEIKGLESGKLLCCGGGRGRVGALAEEEVELCPLTWPVPPLAYAQLQPHQLLSQPPSKHLQPQFVLQPQPQQPAPPPPQQSRPALQAQSHPQLASVPPSLTLQPSPEAHARPLGPVTPALPLQCPTTNLHKAGGTQQCHPPTPDAGPHNGYPEGPAHTPQRRFQHASAVILQLQPASPVVSEPVPASREQAGGRISGNATVPACMCFSQSPLWVVQESPGPLPHWGLVEP